LASATGVENLDIGPTNSLRGDKSVRRIMEMMGKKRSWLRI